MSGSGAEGGGGGGRVPEGRVVVMVGEMEDSGLAEGVASEPAARALVIDLSRLEPPVAGADIVSDGF